MYDKRADVLFMRGEYEKAAEMYLEAARDGDIDASFNYGYCLMHGIGVDYDPAEAKSFFAFARDMEGAEVHKRITNRSAILETGVDVNKIRLVATALFNENDELVEIIGRYGVIWGLGQEGFLFVDYSSYQEYGTFYFTEPIAIRQRINYIPQFTIVGSVDVITAYFTAINDEKVVSTCTGTAEVVGLSNPENYEFLWNDPRKQKRQKAEGLCNGEYTVEVTDKITKESFTLTTFIEEAYSVVE